MTDTFFGVSEVALTTKMATARQRRLALAVGAVLLIATAATVPFGAMPLQPIDGFIPATEAVLVICDLVIAALAVSYAVAIGSRGLLLLAGGFLFDGLIVIPHFLTFPGAFAPDGLLGAGLQTTGWLFLFWHLGLPLAVIGYVLLPREPRSLTARDVYWTTAGAVGLVLLFTWIAARFGNDLPALFADKQRFAPLEPYATGFVFGTSAIALLALMARGQKSIFDLWLTVAVVALVAELAVTAFVMTGRFCLAFYASRLFSVVASIVVLIALLAETARQGIRIARTNLALHLERSRKLTSLDAALAAIVHEVKQPISSIALNAGVAEIIVAGPAPDFKQLREIVYEMVASSRRVNEVFENIRDLFTNSREHLQRVDMNAVVTRVFDGLRVDMATFSITPHLEMEAELPTILGHKGQLEEVVFNLVQNALEAMKSDPVADRSLTVRTEKRGRNAICISVKDSGPGIPPGEMERIFDTFVTTKKSGMGIGLAICRMIIERHDGQLSASSDLGRGAQFDIVLPVEVNVETDRRSA